jgi:hypothetical protein
MFLNIKRTRSQIMNHMKYIYKSQEFFINDKFNHHMFNAFKKKLNNQFSHNFLRNMMFNQIKQNITLL